MLHPQYSLLFPPQLPLRGLVSRRLLAVQVLQEFAFSDPLSVYSIKSPDLPPLVATNDVLEVVRTEPVY